MSERLTWKHAVAATAFLLIGWIAATKGTFETHEVKVPVIHRVTTSDTVYFGKPYAVRGPRQIVYRNVRPDTVLVTLPGRVDTLVQQFTRIASDTTAADSAKHRALVITSGIIGRSDARLFGFTNDGEAYQAHFNVRPPYRFTTVRKGPNGEDVLMDSVEVSQARVRLHLPSLGSVLGCTLFGAGAAVGVQLLR